jgi:hypothetical protein
MGARLAIKPQGTFDLFSTLADQRKSPPLPRRGGAGLRWQEKYKHGQSTSVPVVGIRTSKCPLTGASSCPPRRGAFCPRTRGISEMRHTTCAIVAASSSAQTTSLRMGKATASKSIWRSGSDRDASGSIARRGRKIGSSETSSPEPGSRPERGGLSGLTGPFPQRFCIMGGLSNRRNSSRRCRMLSWGGWPPMAHCGDRHSCTRPQVAIQADSIYSVGGLARGIWFP